MTNEVIHEENNSEENKTTPRTKQEEYHTALRFVKAENVSVMFNHETNYGDASGICAELRVDSEMGIHFSTEQIKNLFARQAHQAGVTLPTPP